MAFSIKQIKAILSAHNLPVDELEKAAEEIGARHAADLDSIKEERDSYKKDAETLAAVKQELEELKAKGGDPYEEKYNELDKEFKEYKEKVESDRVKEQTKAAYRQLLKDAGVSEKRLDSVLKVTDLTDVKLDKDGKIEDAKKYTDSIKAEWADFITKDGQQGAGTPTPPDNNPNNPGNTGRAKQLANMYHQNLYGVIKEDK